MLLVGAVLFVSSLVKLSNIDPGFNSHNVLEISLDPASDVSPDRLRAFYRDILGRVTRLPGITSVSFAVRGPARGACGAAPITIAGASVLELGLGEADAQTLDKDLGPCRDRVGSAYFTTLQTPILAGREFGPHDLCD